MSSAGSIKLVLIKSPYSPVSMKIRLLYLDTFLYVYNFGSVNVLSAMLFALGRPIQDLR